jgi:phosphoribosyl-ATP pyrophosphohydrolase
MHQYLTDSARTAAGTFHRELVPLDLLVSSLGVRLQTNHAVDACKKSLFYGRELPDALVVALQRSIYDGDTFDYTEDPDVIHGVLGIDTESAEIGELLYDALIHGTEIDEAKLKSEMGDLLWYFAVLCRVFGWTFEEIADDNIEKLRRRYPGKFDPARALNRDLAYEDQVFQ